MVWKEPGKDKDPWNTTERPPDLERMVKNLQQRLGRLFGGKRGRPHLFHAATLWWLVPVIIIAWLLSGFYRVTPGDRGANFVFGRFLSAAPPGLRWHAPWPVGHALLVSNVEGRDYTHTYNRLFTGDGNIVVVDALVRYHVVNLRDFLFNAATPVPTPDDVGAGVKTLLGQLANSAIRTAVAHSTLGSIMGGNRDAVEAEARERLNTALQPYASGIAVTRLEFQRVSLPESVGNSDADAQAAQQQATRAADAAHAYADALLPQARAEADAKLAEAQTYRTTLVGEARADTAQFDALLGAYRKAPALTREEVYTQTMQDILTNANKVIVDTRSGNVTVQLGHPFQAVSVPTTASSATPAKAASSTSGGARPASAAPAASTRGG